MLMKNIAFMTILTAFGAAAGYFVGQKHSSLLETLPDQKDRLGVRTQASLHGAIDQKRESCVQSEMWVTPKSTESRSSVQNESEHQLTKLKKLLEGEVDSDDLLAAADLFADPIFDEAEGFVDLRKKAAEYLLESADARDRRKAYDLLSHSSETLKDPDLQEKMLTDSYTELDSQPLVAILSYLANADFENVSTVDSVKSRARELVSHDDVSVRIQALNTYISYASHNEAVGVISRIVTSDTAIDEKLAAIEQLSLLDQSLENPEFLSTLNQLAGDEQSDYFIRKAALDYLIQQ